MLCDQEALHGIPLWELSSWPYIYLMPTAIRENTSKCSATSAMLLLLLLFGSFYGHLCADDSLSGLTPLQRWWDEVKGRRPLRLGMEGNLNLWDLWENMVPSSWTAHEYSSWTWSGTVHDYIGEVSEQTWHVLCKMIRNFSWIVHEHEISLFMMTMTEHTCYIPLCLLLQVFCKMLERYNETN